MTPTLIRATREAAGLTQTAAAALVGVGLRQWQNFENGSQVMKPIYWRVFLDEIKEMGK